MDERRRSDIRLGACVGELECPACGMKLSGGMDHRCPSFVMAIDIRRIIREEVEAAISRAVLKIAEAAEPDESTWRRR